MGSMTGMTATTGTCAIALERPRAKRRPPTVAAEGMVGERRIALRNFANVSINRYDHFCCTLPSRAPPEYPPIPFMFCWFSWRWHNDVILHAGPRRTVNCVTELVAWI